MAQKVAVVLIDDLDGEEADETVTFGLDGVTYEIDLTSPNAEAFRDAISAFVRAARRVRGRRTSRTASRAQATGCDDLKARDVRQWAKDTGYEINDRGRVAREIIAAYQAAH